MARPGYGAPAYSGAPYSGSQAALSGTASFAGTAAITSSGTVSVSGPSSLVGTATMGATGTIVLSGTATFTATATMGATGHSTFSGTATMAGSAVMGATGSIQAIVSGTASFAATAVMGATGTIAPVLTGTASFVASASMAATGALIPPYVPVVGPIYFRTPSVKDEAPYLPDSSPSQVRLFRHYENRRRAVNVWQRSDGTFCQDTPTSSDTDQTSPAAYFTDDPVGPYEIFGGELDSNVNYPWNPYPGAGPEPGPGYSGIGPNPNPGQFVYGTNWDGTTFTEQLNPYLLRWFQPASTIEVTQEEALELTAAGYGDNIS